jgi:hypothetical protein
MEDTQTPSWWAGVSSWFGDSEPAEPNEAQVPIVQEKDENPQANAGEQESGMWSSVVSWWAGDGDEKENDYPENVANTHPTPTVIADEQGPVLQMEDADVNEYADVEETKEEAEEVQSVGEYLWSFIAGEDEEDATTPPPPPRRSHAPAAAAAMKTDSSAHR